MKKKSAPAGVIVILLLGMWLVRSHQPTAAPTTASPPRAGASPTVTLTLPEERPARNDAAAARKGTPTGPRESAPYQVEGMRIVDINTGKTLPVRTVNLRPTLERIAAGENNAHRNDGTVFRNAQRKLPRKPSGYYREYVVPTDGVRGPGPQRLVLGEEGEIYYTPDHYETFIRVLGDTGGKH